MDRAFHNAIPGRADARTEVLGLTLRPLTVGHLFVLDEIECAYPHFYEDAKLGDLLAGVLACSQRSASRARRILSAFWLPAFMRFWQRRTRKRSLQEESLKFQVWICSEIRSPRTSGGKPGELRAPLGFRLMALLMADFHFSREQALATPVKEALCLWATEADRRGALELFSDRERWFEEWAAEQEAKRLAAAVEGDK